MVSGTRARYRLNCKNTKKWETTGQKTRKTELLFKNELFSRLNVQIPIFGHLAHRDGDFSDTIGQYGHIRH